MKKWIALLLAVLLTTSLFPTVTAAKAEADSSDIWAEIARIEDGAINARTVQTEAAAAAYAANVDKIIAAVEASDACVPGSINRHGDFFYFTTTDGQVNGYSPRLRAKIRGAKATGADPEAVSGVETTSFGTRGGWPGSKNVAVFQPYYGLDSSFTTQYPNEGVSIAQATGGTSTTYKTNDATVDAIADAIESCGVVIFDSHGDTDYANGYDYTSRANTSYICLQSGTGLTSADQATVTGPYGTYHHAYYAGSGYGGMKYYCVDGTAISNHMERNSPNGLLWMAICLGMATDGLEAPMRDRGVEVVYGYSQSVTFAGDFAWEEVFWDEMIAGKDVAASISAMKTQIGCPDPNTTDYPAWPIVVSDEDAYPGHGNVDAAQTVYSTWTLQQGFEVSAYSGDETRGTVSVMGTTITAMPKVGCYTSGYEVTSGVATVEQNGDVLEVTPESDCVIRVDFADKNPAALTYHVPAGVSCPAPYQGYEKDSVTIPTPKGTPTADGEDYFFYGWTTAEVEDVDTLPQPVYKPGEVLDLPAGQTDLYALYRYFKPDDPTVHGQFLRLDAEPQSWEGEIVITYQSQKALDASGKYTGTAIGSKSAVVDLEQAGVVVSDNYLMNVPDEMIYVASKNAYGSFQIRMKNAEFMLCVSSDTNSLTTTKAAAAKAARWNMQFTNGNAVLQSVNYPARTLQYDTSLTRFRAYNEGAKEPLTVYQANPGKMMYATILHDKVVCDEHDFTDWTVTAEATCVAAGERSHYCRVCGFAETEVLPIDPNHHTSNTEQHGEVKPTCTEDGKKADTYCADCGAKLADGETIPALGHAWSEPVFTWSGYESAKATRTCERDASHTETKDAAVTKEVTQAPTPTTNGIRTYTASVVFDGVTYTDTKTETIPAIVYTWGEPTWEWAEDGSAATATFTANEDASIQQTLDAEISSVVKTKPGCETPGLRENTAKVTFQEREYTDVRTYEIPATGHGWSEPAFTWNGYESATATRICAKDLTHVETKDAVVTAEVTTAPTMTEDGVRTYTAAVEFDGVTYTDTKTETIPATGLVNPFVDVKEGDFFYDAVLWAFYHDPQITAGTSKTKFSPSNTCTREQVVTFLWRAKGCQEPTNTENPFKDVPADAYYTKAVLWAVENGITNGKSKTKFGVGDPCTREQVVTFLWRAEGEPEHETIDNPFTDVSETAYSYNAILWAVEKGITNGTSKTKFSPTKTCTRGEVVTFLWRNDQNK